MFPNVHERACYEHSKSFRFRAKKEGKKFAESFPHDGGAQCAKNGKVVPIANMYNKTEWLHDYLKD